VSGLRACLRVGGRGVLLRLVSHWQMEPDRGAGINIRRTARNGAAQIVSICTETHLVNLH
jgi:hypothetical protein